MQTGTDIDQDVPRQIPVSRGLSDRVFRVTATSAGTLTLVILVLIGAFLLIRAIPAFQFNGIWNFLTGFAWDTENASHEAGVGAVMIGTFIVSAIALVIALPISVGCALLATELAPPKLKRGLVTTIDLMAAIPAIIFALWGFFFLQPRLLGFAEWVSLYFAFIPFLRAPLQQFVASQFIVGVVIALMIVPTATSVIREVFAQTPQGEKEAALALGSTRWEMIRSVVIPFGSGGIVGGSMLALGRALGEAIVVAILISPIFEVNPYILQTGGNTVGGMIANRFGESSAEYGIPALMAAGLVLFLTTLLINSLASLIVRRSRSGSGVEI